MELQMEIGEVNIGDIQFDMSSRDEIPKLLMGLQAIYEAPEVRDKIFKILLKIVPKDVNPNRGRKGMDLWKILVLGTLRLGCNWDYDKLKEIADNHKTLRQMLGHSFKDLDYRYPLQTLKDNIALFTQEVLDEINQQIIKLGHKVIGKESDEPLKGSCDSFPLETNVHFPTDTNLLFDALRKIIVLIVSLCDSLGLTGWRKSADYLRRVKKILLRIQRLNNSKPKKPKNIEKKAKLKILLHTAYIALAEYLIKKAQKTIASISSPNIFIQLKIDEIKNYIAHAERQVDQIRRRVIKNEKIPHKEKVFSIFEEYTEWLSKGKMGVIAELGLNICIVKDQFGFILHHIVMQNKSDVDVAVPIISETIEKFPNFSSCSFDKGFHSTDNQTKLAALLDEVTLPRKGRLSQPDKEIENTKEFKEARKKHPAVESSINALGKSGLDRCPDHGIDGFKRYVALGILARNIQILGNAVQQQRLNLKTKRKKIRIAA